jgi:DNA-binding CsgD family transcriptional regulator
LKGAQARQTFLSGAVADQQRRVEEAVRHLIELAVRAPGLQPDASDVLVDITIGHTRCLVTQALSAHTAAASDILSPREQEIARMVARGYTNKEIAKVLDISSWTVSAHLRRVFSKLDVTTRAAMVARLLRQAGSLAEKSPKHHLNVASQLADPDDGAVASAG